MCALRLLHRDLPDLSGPGGRARWSARAHRADAAYAGERCATHGRDGEASRPLSFMPGLQDGLPIGRGLFRADRYIAQLYRPALPTAFSGTTGPPDRVS